MSLTRPSDADLAGFMNEPENFLFGDGGYGTEALDQAVDLLVIASGTDVEPVTSINQRIVSRAICQMAEALIKTIDERFMPASVIGKEQAGNYSYSVIKDKVVLGVPLGLLWFDLAVELLQELNGTTAGTLSSSITVFDDEHMISINGKKRLLGPYDEGHLSSSIDIFNRNSWW